MIRIGTRKSDLAQWQAKLVAKRLEELGQQTKLVLIDSFGDQNQVQPLYELGVSGVFTKALDIALLNDTIDIAVHSMKDVPVILPKGIEEYAVLERGVVEDILVKNQSDEKIIATSSLRRKAQWLAKYPDFQIEDLRGNVNTRLRKVEESNWQGAIFAKAGLERINVLPENYEILDWMIPAPAQGALMIVGKSDNLELKEIHSKLYCHKTANCVAIERGVLRRLEGGCTAPIAVYVQQKSDSISVQAGIYLLDGSKSSVVDLSFANKSVNQVIDETVTEILKNGGEEILKQIKKDLSE